MAKELTARQKAALKRHKEEHGHTQKHINEMTRLMTKEGKTFTEAHRITMRTKGK